MGREPRRRGGWRGGAIVLALSCAFAACANPGGTGTSSRADRESEGSATAGAGLDTGWTEAECLTPSSSPDDRDHDGVRDGCEHDLAAAFAPVLVVDRRECGWDESVPGGRLGGEYLYAAQRRPSGGGMRIAYMPAYYRDCGWRLPVCRLTPWLCDGHLGDSELVAVEVAFDPEAGLWAAERVFLSAHCHGRSDGRCRWYEGRELARFSWADEVARGAPVVWVAHGKHAGYPTAGECDTGYWRYDGCGGNLTAYRYPVVSLRQNAGSRARPFPHGKGADCVGPDEAGWGSTLPDAGRTECFWDEEVRFLGWQAGDEEGATGYGRYLREVAGF